MEQREGRQAQRALEDALAEATIAINGLDQSVKKN